MTARPSIALFQLTPVYCVSRAAPLSPFETSCLKLAEALEGDRPQTKNGIEARLEKSTSVFLGNKCLLCFCETSIARTKVLEVVWGADEATPSLTITQIAHHLDALGLVQSFLAPTPSKPAPKI